MFHREGQRNAFKVPAYDQPVGYDLEKQDFVSPHGKGVHPDLFFEFKRDFKNSHNFDVSCKMTFPNKHDGIQECYFEDTMQSSYKWPYLAPTNSYKSAMIWQSTRSDANPPATKFAVKVPSRNVRDRDCVRFRVPFFLSGQVEGYYFSYIISSHVMPEQVRHVAH